MHKKPMTRAKGQETQIPKNDKPVAGSQSNVETCSITQLQ